MVANAKEDEEALLQAWRKGDDLARDHLFRLLHGEISTIASLLLRREREQISLFTGDLVNEAIVRLFQSATISVTDKNHLLALSARVMRHVLLDAAREKARQKKKGIHVTLTQPNDGSDKLDLDLLALERALVRLGAIDPTLGDIVELRYFGGLTVEEIADVHGMSPATVKRRWAAARLWLKEAIENDI